MAEASIPVDLLNPGQVFACMGFLEAADVLCGDAEGGFDWSAPADVRFRLRAKGVENPVEFVLQFLANAKVHSIAPARSALSTEKWKVPTKDRNTEFPFPLPSSPATLPAVLEAPSGTRKTETTRLVIDHWGEVRRKTSRDNVKFWAGSGGYPGAALTRDALDMARDALDSARVVSNPFAFSRPQSSSFRFDWRRDYIAKDIGFSLNNHAKGTFIPMGFPIVEIMAAIGMTNARPKALSKLEYRYMVASVLDDRKLLDISLLRATLGGAELPFLRRTFRMRLNWPGKEGQARCITNVTEEITND